MGKLQDLIDQRKASSGKTQELLADRKARISSEVQAEVAKVAELDLERILGKPRGVSDLARIWKWACLEAGYGERYMTVPARDMLRLKQIAASLGSMELACTALVECASHWPEFLESTGEKLTGMKPELWFMQHKLPDLVVWLEKRHSKPKSKKQAVAWDPEI